MGGIAGGLVAILRGVGAIFVAILVGPKRAGRAAAFETILGGLVLGAVIGFVVQATGLHVFYAERRGSWGASTGDWLPIPASDVAITGGVMGVLAAICLYGLKKLLDKPDNLHPSNKRR